MTRAARLLSQKEDKAVYGWCDDCQAHHQPGHHLEVLQPAGESDI
jgi:hypothetical protein